MIFFVNPPPQKILPLPKKKIPPVPPVFPHLPMLDFFLIAVTRLITATF